MGAGRARVLAVAAAVLVVGLAATWALHDRSGRVALDGFPADVPWDYQLQAPYEPAPGVGVVTRDWFDGVPAGLTYDICYVNAFQTQDDDASVTRPDERSAWPSDLVLTELGDDPAWGGEHLIDLSMPAARGRAVDWVRPMLQTCADKGFDAVELDNLDSWTRFDGTPLAAAVPFGEQEALAYARALVELADGLGLATAQKNTVQIGTAGRDDVGFAFAVVEECGAFDECGAHAAVWGDAMVVVEYTDEGFAAACEAVGASVSVIRRDLLLAPAVGGPGLYEEC